MNKFFYCSYFVLILVGCQAGAENADDRAKTIDPLAAFNDFPDSLFNGIYWDQPFADARNNLYSKGFEQVDSSGSFSFLNRLDSTEVLIPEGLKIQSLKLVLRSTVFLSQKKRLMDGFNLLATATSHSPEFSVFEYDLGLADFKLTTFNQSDFIRLNFELEKRH